jgi:integrase
VYTVKEYLEMLRLARRSDQTIDLYRKVLLSYSRFVDVPLDQIHYHLYPENLIKYAGSRMDKSERGTQLHLSILNRYFEINGVKFNTLERNVIKSRNPPDHHDKPLQPEILLKMIDRADLHMKAVITTLVSTGMRSGECSNLLLSDLDGDTITIRKEIAKRRQGGKVYLTSEAQQYMKQWLEYRDEYIRQADKRSVGLGVREGDDARLFACHYQTMRRKFSRLYDLVDGERGKYHAKCTLHSTRRFFRTHAVKSLGIDLTEHLMRHRGYMTASYRRISDDDARKQFFEGESVLYITRVGELTKELDEVKAQQKEQIAELERRMALVMLHMGEGGKK